MCFQKRLLRGSSDRRDDRPLRWPSNASRKPGASPVRHPDRHRLHTNRPVLPRPSRSSAARRSRDGPVPVPLCDAPHTAAPCGRPPCIPAPLSRMRSQMRLAVWRCFRGALRSASRIASMNSTAGAIFICGRSVFLRRAGIALWIASRTTRRCTRSFRATPWIVPTPNSYSNRICSNSSTLALQSNSSLQIQAHAQIQSRSLLCPGVGQNKCMVRRFVASEK